MERDRGRSTHSRIGSTGAGGHGGGDKPPRRPRKLPVDQITDESSEEEEEEDPERTLTPTPSEEGENAFIILDSKGQRVSLEEFQKRKGKRLTRKKAGKVRHPRRPDGNDDDPSSDSSSSDSNYYFVSENR